MDEQYIDVIPVQCTLPNNFQLCNAFENGLCFSGCGTCNTKNTETDHIRYDTKKEEA
jgi:hypothetical protein